jgi:thymidylate synthase
MNNTDKAYLDLLKEVREKGIKKADRTGTGTVSIFGRTLKFDMKEGFPLLTTKKIHTKSVIHELLWFLQGDHNIKYLVDNGVNIWNEWPYKRYVDEWMKENPPMSGPYTNTMLLQTEFIERIKTDDKFAEKWGELGPVYGKQWRQWQGWMKYKEENNKSGYGLGSIWYDQILMLVQQLKTNPDSRRLMVNAWNVAEIDTMLLPPCHYGFQCWTRELTLEEKIQWVMKNTDVELENLAITEAAMSESTPKRALSLMWQQRSVDLFLGLPFNIASYGLLLEMLAQSCNMVADELIFNGGDCHIYVNHFDQVDEQLKREPMELCTLKLTKPESEYSSLHGNNGHIIEYKYENFEFVGYKSHPVIKAPIAV